MDRLESMSVFVAVVAAGSFSAASRQLRMPLPTVSRKVAEIESHLNAKLLVRSTRKLMLTEAGPRTSRTAGASWKQSPKPSGAHRRIQRAARRTFHHGADCLRPPARRARRRRAPPRIPRRRRETGAHDRELDSSTTTSTSPCASARCQTVASSPRAVGQVRRSCARARPTSTSTARRHARRPRRARAA